MRACTCKSFGVKGISTPIRRLLTVCARAARGHVAADPAIPITKSRRLIALPSFGTTKSSASLKQEFATSDTGATVNLRCNIFLATHVGSGGRRVIFGCRLRPVRVRYPPFATSADGNAIPSSWAIISRPMHCRKLFRSPHQSATWHVGTDRCRRLICLGASAKASLQSVRSGNQ